MSTIENKDKLRTLHKNLTQKIDGFAMPYNEFAKRMEDDEERSRLNLNLSKKIKGYSLTNEELDSILGVVKSDLPSPADEIQQMSRPENNTAIINDLSENLLKESNEIKKETEDPSIFETVGKGLASGIVRVGSGLMNQFSKVDPAILSSVAGGPNYVALYDPNRKTGKEQEKAAIEAATELRHISERLADEATPSNAKEKGFLGSLAEGNIGDAFQYALATTAQSIPQMLGYMNIYTMLPLAYAEFGAKMNELEESNPNMKEGKKIASAFGSTLIEVAIERLSGDFMKMFRGKVKPEQAKQITQELARQLERNVYKRALGHSLDFSKGVAKSATGEGIEEGLTYLFDKGYNSLIDLDGTDGVGLRSQYEKFKQQNPYADAGDFAKIITSELLESVAQGAMGGAYMHAGTSAAAGVVNSFNKNRQIDNKVTVEAIKRVASEEGLKRLDVINKWGDVLSKKISGEELSEEEIDFYNKIVNKKSQVAKFYGNINQSEMPKYNWSKDQLTEEQKKEYNRTIAEADKEKVEVAPVEIVLEEQEKQADTPSPIVSSTPTSSGAVSTPEIDTEVEVAKANATFGKASNKDGNLYEVSAFVNGKNVEGALKGEVVLTEDGKLDIENSKGLMFIPKGNGKYTSKAIPLTDTEYNSVTINNVFNKEQYAEQAVSNAKQAAQAVSLNELIREALQAQSTPETAENGVAETSSSTEGGVTDNAVGNQVSYPTKKDGSIDYDNLTPEQEYSLTAQEYGEDVAQEDVKSYIEQYQSAIDNIQSQLDSKNGTNSRAKMREAMRKNQEKLEAWKALLKEEVVEQQEVAPVEETNALPKDVKTEDGNPVVEENSMPKDVNAEDVNKQTIDGGEKASTGEDVSLVEGIDRFLTGDEAQAFIAEMENSAEIAPEIELNIENWDALFGEDGRVETPIGEVKMGENQFAKLMRQGRNGKLGMIKPTLENPHAIVEVASEAKEGDTTERASSYIFIRSFKKADGSRFYYFTSITVSKDGREVVVSSQEKSRNKILRLLQEGSVIWRTPKDATTSSAERQGLDYEQPNEAETATKGSGITPQSTSSASEDTNIVPEKQEKVVESDENNNQTPEEVVQQAAIDTAEKRKEDALASFAESGAYTEALGAATEDTARKAEAFFKVIEEYGVRLTTKAPSINGNYIQFVQGRIGKLSEEQQSEVMEAAVAYKRAYMDQLVIEKFNSELANITDSKIHEEQTNSANEAIRNVKAANDNMLNDMVAKGDFSNEHMLITSHKDTEKSDVHTLEKPLLKERNNAMDDYQKRYDEVVNLNKTEERAKKRSEKRADVREGDIKRKKVWIKNREGEIVEGWVKGDETFESSGAYTIFRNETGKERYTPRKRKDIFKDENGSDSYAPVVKQGESEIEKRTIRIKRDVKTSDVSKNIVDLIGKIKTGDVGSVSELKDIIKSLKSKIVTLCKKINESDFSDEVKVYLLDELDSTYFFAEQQETDGVQKSPTPTKGKVADAILKIRTTPQQRRGNRTYVDDKGNVKERKNETFETIEDLLGANNEVVEIISDKLNNVHEIIEESESSLIVETPLYSEGTMSNSNPISLNEALKGIANLVRGFNLQGRIVVAMNLEQLKKINEKAYEAELNGEEVRGFYLPSKHQIVLYVPNLLSKGSVENVIFHEGVAHFGLRELLGEEEFNNFCKQVWKSMPYADKKAMMEYIGKEYVYNQKVSEGDMIAAAEEYVAHLAETPMFAEYLRNRNEQEAVSWIAKKWKKVCNLIRKIFKKRTGEELLSSDENIMDALYRSYQLLGSNDYAMFDYYRSLTEQMRKEDVKVGEINEEDIEEAYVNKATLGDRSDADSHNSSSEGLLSEGSERLSVNPLTPSKDIAKIANDTEITKRAATKIINEGGIKSKANTPAQAVSALGKGLHLDKSDSSQSYYGDFFEGDYIVNGKVVHLRISTHPATPVRIGNAEADHKVSIVIRKNGEHRSDGTTHGGYTEYVYEPSEVTPQDAANAVVKGVKSLLDTGEFVDETGRAVRRDYPYTDNRGRTMYSRITTKMDDYYIDDVENGDITPQDSESGVRFSKVTDPFKIAELEAGEKMKTYRAMALIDGKLYPPMSSKNDGVLREPSEIGVWEEAEENPDKAKEKNGKYYFTLIKDNGKNVRDVAYNPYLHSSTTMLNDQFKEAQSRDNLVVVEMEIPTSELTSGYKADKAHDAVGTKDWKAGTIQGQLTGTREVVLSRWGKPVRIVPVEEVADNIKGLIDGQVEYMPTNVVTPQQRKALEDLGVKFVETNNNEIIQEGEHKGERYSAIYGKKAKNKNAEQGTILFSKGKPAGYVNLSNKFKPQKQPMSALVAREQAVANAVMEWFREMVGAENIVTNVRAMTDVYINALNNGERIRVLHTSKKGEDVILGFEHNGVHYLDMDAMDSGLLLYELGTVWVDILKKNDALWERAKEVCQSTKEYKSLVKTAAYKRGEVTEEDVVKEVLAYYISELGTRLGNNLNVSNDIKEEFEYKIGFAFAELKNTLSRFDEYELSKLGVEDFARLSLRDIVLNTSMADSEAVVSELDDSDKGETLSEKRLKNSTYGWTSPRKNETTGEYLERMSRWHSHFLSRQTRRDGDSIIAMIQSAVEKASGKMIPEAIDVYNIIDSINSVIANRVETFEKKLWNPLRNTMDSMGKKLMRNKEINSIRKARKLSTIEWYLRAKDIVEYSEIHNKDRGRKGLENVLGMTLERYIGIVEGTLGQDNINSLWDKINEITNITIKNKESAGVLDATDLATMKRRYYIPEKGFDTDAETDNDGNKKLTRKSNRVSSSYQKERSTKGRGNTVSDSPSFNIFTDMVASIQAKEHTRLNNAFYGLIEYAELYDKGIADRFFKRTENGSLIHKEGGDIRVGNLNDNDYLVFNETKLGRKLKEVLETNPESISAFTSWWKGWVSKTNTAWRLSFAITNLGKDLFQTIPVVYMKYGPKTTGKVILNLLNPVTIFELLSYIYARKTYKSDNIYLSGVYGQEKLIKEFFENGVATGYLEYRNDDDVRKAIGKGLFDTWKNKYRESALGQKTSQIESPIWLENVGDLAGKIVTSPKYIGKAVRGISDWSEIAARYALYKTLREDNYSMHSARMAARNTTMNLGRDAGGKIYKTLGRIFPFYRATVNAGEAWNRALFEMQEGDNGYKKTLRVVTMLAPAVILGLFTFNDDDDDEEEDSFIRTNNFFSKFFINNFPVNVSESYVPFLQLGNGIKRYLKGEKEASDVALDFTAGICQTVITSNTFSETLIDMAKSMLTKGTIEEKDFERLISQYLNELPLATAAVNMDAFGNKIATENNDKNDWANASGEADYIFRAIADYLHGFDDERLGEKKSYIGFDEKGEIETFDAKTMYDVNSDILQAVVYQLFKPAEEAIKPLSNILEQKVKGEEFSWMELGQNVPVIKKSFVDYPKTSKEKLESSVRLLTKFDNYVSHASKGEGFNQLNNKEKSMYNNYIKSSLFEDDNTKLNDNAAQWIMEGGLKKTIIADIEYAIEYGDEKYCEKVFREYDDYVRNVRKFMFGN